MTGAASGIGRAIARAVAAAGARTVISDIDEGAGEALAVEIGAAFIASDLSKPDSPRALWTATVAKLERVSVFVHSAAPRRRETQTALAVSEREWDEMTNVALRSGFVLGQAAGAHMRAFGLRGRMLFVTSLHAHTPRNLPHYSAAKAGTTMVVAELARALGPSGIRVNAIAPGAIAGGGFNADIAALERKIALGRMGTPDDIAAMAIPLLDDTVSAYVTGTTVVVDGGLALYNWIEAPST